MMAKGPSYNVPYRRRREGKTNYLRRKKLVLSGLPRLVARKTNKHIIAQIIEASIEGDKVIASAHSSELKKYGWLGSLKSLPAAYLTGLICGYKALKKDVKKAVLDIGLQAPSKGACVFAVLKGCLDAGVEVPHGEEILPDEDRIKGQHISDYAKTLSADPDVYRRRFSAYLKRGFPPENLVEHFSAVKEKIMAEFEE